MAETKKTFAEMREELARRKGRTIQPESPKGPATTAQFDEDLVPENPYAGRDENELEIDGIIQSIDILDAYRKWIGKEVDERTTSQTEGIKVSCPIPGHRDSHPSAWLNTDNKRWFCGGCQEGGDVYDLGAIHFGYARPDYKEGKTFHDLRKEMAESYGYRFKTIAGTEIIWREDESGDNAPEDSRDGNEVRELAGSSDSESSELPVSADPEGSGSVEAKEAPSGAPAGTASVTTLHERDVADVADNINYPVLDWRSIVPEGTFLWEYLEATSKDDSPEEYHFWHGLIALGHAAGRNAYLNDTRPVYGNLLVCLLGGTGYGKSRSRYWLDEVIEEVLPFRDNGLDTSGCKLVPVPASGENLINQFQHIASDPSMPKGSMPTVRTPVNGIVDYDEFASLLARASRQGSTLKQIIMAFSDARSRISTSSNTGGTFEAYQPFCTITASTQPKAVRPLLARTDTASGFLNRWLFVGGPRKKREVMGGSHSSIHVDLSKAQEQLKFVRGWAGVERDVRFTEEGLDEYERFVRVAVFPVQDADESDLLTRLDLTMKRLVLLLCVNERKTEADAVIVKRCEPILNYLIKCYGILNAEIGVTQMAEITSEILRHITNIEAKTHRGASARDITLRMKRKNYSPEMIKKALETMVALDWIDVDKSKGPGRPTVRYRAVGS